MLGKNTVLLFILNVILVFCLAEIQFDYTTVGTLENLLEIKRLNFTQLLDHKNPEDERKFIQRYAVTPTFYKKFGPAFLFVNGEGPLERKREFTNHVLAYAQNLNAICFSLEHRFYGGSWPVNGSLVNHLSSAQALSDIAYFITGVTKEFHLPKDTKWIIFGCSYAGTLALWSRLKYSDIIHGAVASSAPVLAKVDYFEYNQIVEESFKRYDPKCIESITLAFEEIAHLVNNSEIKKKLTQMFHLYDEASRTIDRIKTIILHKMLMIFEEVVQNNDTYPIPIPLLCTIMIEYNGTKLEALAEVNMKFEYDMQITPQKSLNQYSKKNEDSGISTATHPEQSEIVWRYQRCSEFGYFSSYANVSFLSGVKHLLVPVEKDIENLCKPWFNPNFSVKNVTENISRTNSQYGGLHFNVSNTILINGSMDPWHKASLYKKLNGSLYNTIFIEGTSHCADTIRPKKTDIPELINARLQVFKILHSWLNEIPTSNNSRN